MQNEENVVEGGRGEQSKGAGGRDGRKGMSNSLGGINECCTLTRSRMLKLALVAGPVRAMDFAIFVLHTESSDWIRFTLCSLEHILHS